MSAPTVPEHGAATPVDAHAVVGAHPALHRTRAAQRRVDHRDRRVGGFHGGLLHTVLHTVEPFCRWWQLRRRQQLRAIHHAADHLQAVAFAAISSAFRAATDSLQGVNRRFRSMPIAPLTPVLARVSASVCRCCVGLTVSLICGHAIGFRFHHGAPYIAGFCVLVIVIGASLSFAADLIAPLPATPTRCCRC